MRADLHMHSVWSDGAYTPEELARRAKAAGLDLISITDHDNMGGLPDKRAAAEKFGLAYISGWEVSSYKNNQRIHVLGYGCTAGEAYRDFLEKRKTGAILRAKDMLEKANDYLGLDVSLDEVEEFHRHKEVPVHTMHVVSAFAKRLDRDGMELYASMFNIGKPAYSELGRPSPEEAIEVIHAAGGVAVLAHPGRIFLPFEERESLMQRLVLRGLDGIECRYTTHTVTETEYFLAFAKENGLLVTGGSDFHRDDGVHFIGKPDYVADERLLGLSARGDE